MQHKNSVLQYNMLETNQPLQDVFISSMWYLV